MSCQFKFSLHVTIIRIKCKRKIFRKNQSECKRFSARKLNKEIFKHTQTGTDRLSAKVLNNQINRTVVSSQLVLCYFQFYHV